MERAVGSVCVWLEHRDRGSCHCQEDGGGGGGREGDKVCWKAGVCVPSLVPPCVAMSAAEWFVVL